jgi:hypothetical protein
MDNPRFHGTTVAFLMEIFKFDVVFAGKLKAVIHRRQRDVRFA